MRRLAPLAGVIALLLLAGATAAQADIAAEARISPRIVGGASVSIRDFPFQVALYNPKASSLAAGFFCGGVILDANHVITVAHCLFGAHSGRVSAPREIEVLAGSTELSPTDPGSVRDPVTAVAVDPRYNATTSDYDVGLLTLARRLWTGATPPSVNGIETIAPLSVSAADAASVGNPNAAPPVIATIAGWGDLNPSPTGTPNYPLGLRAARMPLVPDRVCSELFGGIEQVITPRMICAGDLTHRADSCFGDSGGPLLADRNSPADAPADYVLIGLVDFGNGCAQRGYPGVYVRTGNPEIERFLASGSGHETRLAVRHSRKKRRRRRH